MSTKQLGAALLLIFLVWRATNSMWVTAVDHSRSSPLWLGLDSTEARVRRGLAAPIPGQPADRYYRQLQLLRLHVPENAKVYYLHEFTGPGAYHVIVGVMKLNWLSYPRYIQAIQTLPLPGSASRPPLQGKPTFVLDVRENKPDVPGADYDRVAEEAGAVLWRKKGRQ